MKNIFHINSYFTTTPLHSELIYYLDSHGYSQTVYIPVGNKKNIGKHEPENLKQSKLIYSHCFGSISRLLWPIKMIKIWFDFKKTFNKNTYQIIHAHTLIVNGLIAYMAHKKWGTPYVVTLRSTDINFFLKKSIIFKKIGIKVLEAASAVITISPAYKDVQLPRFFYSKKHQSIKDKTYVIPNGINDFWLNNKFLNDKISKRVKILFVGGIIKRKNLNKVIESCDKLINNKFLIELNIVGDGPLFKKFKEKKNYDYIKYFGRVSDKNKLMELYRNADILVVPSITETFGLVYPEAMSQGLPVIYTKGQGFDGFFSNGTVGFSINPRSSDEIADSIKKIISNYSFYSNNAFKESSRFSWETITNKLICVYNKIESEK